MLVGASGEEGACLSTTEQEPKPFEGAPRMQQPDDKSKRLATQLRRWQPRFLWAWTIHFAITFAIVLYGILANGGRVKYYPAHANAVRSCERAYLNVLAASTEEQGAIVCCDGGGYSSTSICASKESKPHFFLLSGSLARFPDAWILPLMPIVLRLLYNLFTRMFGRSDGERLSTTILRLCLYVVTLNFRGWILYVWLGYLESLVVMPVGEECWYRELLPNSSCHARIFDFSDHTVLYMAQILPLPLMETLHSFALPFWRSNTFGYVFFLSFGLAYLYVITLMGQFKTAAYFHTGGEVLAGYIISLSVQMPYAILQCCRQWEGMRLWLFEYPRLSSRND